MTTTTAHYTNIIHLNRASIENPQLDGLLRRAARNPGERFLSYGSNRAAVNLAVQQIKWAAEGGRFAHLPAAQEQAKSAAEWLEHHGLDASGKPVPLAA